MGRRQRRCLSEGSVRKSARSDIRATSRGVGGVSYTTDLDSATQAGDSQLFVNSAADRWFDGGPGANIVSASPRCTNALPPSPIFTDPCAHYCSHPSSSPHPVAVQAQSPSQATTSSAKTPSDTARAGKYQLEITDRGRTMVGELALSKTSDGFAASLVAGGNRPAVKSFVRQNGGYVLTGGHGDFVITYTLKFANDSVTGSLKMSTGPTGTVAGVRTP